MQILDKRRLGDKINERSSEPARTKFKRQLWLRRAP